jgi:CheY-like chemotaxis protein
MTKPRKPWSILIADDDAEDCMLVAEALTECGRPHVLATVRNGEELWEHLVRSASAPLPVLPDLILLDLKMPKKDGRESLRELKADPRFRSIPVVMLTTSTDKEDIGFCYRAGANSYVTKPATFRGLVELMQVLGNYWDEWVERP